MALILFPGCNKLKLKREVSLDEVAKAYVRLGFALGEHDRDSLDYFYGDPAWVADLRSNAPSATEIRTSAVRLIEVVNTMDRAEPASAIRMQFLSRQLESIACRAALLAGAPTSFEQEAHCAFGFDAHAYVPAAQLDRIRAEISRELSGYEFSQGEALNLRYAKYESQFIVPVPRLRAVMERAIAGCRTQTAKHISLPQDESIELELTHDKPWAAYSLYLGHHRSRVSINVDDPVTIDRALDLACHETYPGHHTFNLTQADALVAHGPALELSIQPTYSPQSFVSEGAATIASDLAFTVGERLRFERYELLPLAGMKDKDLRSYLHVEALVQELHSVIPAVARDYIDGQTEFSRASSQLEEEALMDGTFEVLKYLNEFRSYVVTYTVAPDVLSSLLAPCSAPRSAEQRWSTYTGWMRDESMLYAIPAHMSPLVLQSAPNQKKEFVPCMN